MSNLAPYPIINSYAETPELEGVFSYIIEPYNPGHTYSLLRDNGDVRIQFALWNGNILDGVNVTGDMLSHAHSMVEMVKLIGISFVQFYISDNNRLVDVRISDNKFFGPGMLRDLFAKKIPVQNTIKIDRVSESVMNAYPGHIIKPSRFRYKQLDNCIIPLYAKLDIKI